MIRWVIDQEPALSAGVAAAVAVVSSQAAVDGWTWAMLWAVLPLALAAGVRAVVFSRRTVAAVVAGQRAEPELPRFVAQTVQGPDEPE